MMSMRLLARSAPRTMHSRLGATMLRQSSAAAFRPVPLRSSAVPLRSSPLASAFSTTPRQRADTAGEVDGELSLKLESEMHFEGEMAREESEQPASVKDFLVGSQFELIDVKGQEDVILRKTFGNETITVKFSISDLNDYDEDDNDMPYSDEDEALGDEDAPEATGSRPSRRRQQQRRQEAAEDEDTVDEEADMEDEREGPVPYRLNVVVEKQGQPGALNVEAVAENGNIVVENFFYYRDADLAHGRTAEASRASQDAYPGPPFSTLDEDLQILMERYLEERGITTALAVFVPDYVDLKEQNEYKSWLKDVKNFIDA